MGFFGMGEPPFAYPSCAEKRTLLYLPTHVGQTVWKQPTGAQDVYRLGDKVHYPTKDDPVYVSTIDYNVYSPDTYGWELVI